LLALELGFAEHAAYPQLLTVRDCVIQRFEIAMDLSWKLLQRTLKMRFEVTEVLNYSSKKTSSAKLPNSP
jgi:Nucleotidyltransferase substrate binding protein like